MKGIYLAACKARHYDYDIVYQDIDNKYKCDIGGDMLEIDISSYDFIIATPPCNWWSKANPYYKTSKYALETKHLLKDSIIKCVNSKKHFIIENVINKKRMREEKIFELCDTLGVKYQFVGRHTYFTDLEIDLQCEQHQDFKYGGIRVNNDGYNQGGSNVHVVIEKWLNAIVNNVW